MIPPKDLPTRQAPLTDKQKEVNRTRKLTMISQWDDGNPIHMKIDGHELCCPDMSCCFPELLAPKPFRTLYLKAFEEWDGSLLDELMKTFTEYWTSHKGYRIFYEIGEEPCYYTDWVEHSVHFTEDDRKEIIKAMKEANIKY